MNGKKKNVLERADRGAITENGKQDRVNDGGNYAEGGYPFHEVCVGRHFHCGGCNRIVHEDYGVRIAGVGVMVCASCLGKLFCECEDCGRYVSEDNSFALGSGGRVCGHCIERGYYSRCADCGGIFHESDLNYFHGEEGCCDNCFMIRLNDSSLAIHPYLYDPD